MVTGFYIPRETSLARRSMLTRLASSLDLALQEGDSEAVLLLMDPSPGPDSIGRREATSTPLVT